MNRCDLRERLEPFFRGFLPKDRRLSPLNAQQHIIMKSLGTSSCESKTPLLPANSLSGLRQNRDCVQSFICKCNGTIGTSGDTRTVYLFQKQKFDESNHTFLSHNR